MLIDDIILIIQMSNFGAYLKTKNFRNNLILAICTTLVLFLAAFFSLGYYTRHGSGIPVPKLKGMQVEKALSLLKDQGFGYQIDSVYVLDEPPGTIVEQDPDAGTNVVDVYVNYVRRKLLLAGSMDLIQTVRGEGYSIGLRKAPSRVAPALLTSSQAPGQLSRVGAA